MRYHSCVTVCDNHCSISFSVVILAAYNVVIEMQTITQLLNPEDISAVLSQSEVDQNQAKLWPPVASMLTAAIRLDTEFGAITIRL